ncbi:MAG: hypothetical protein QXI60_07210 [Thermofilaceae archaeon]
MRRVKTSLIVVAVVAAAAILVALVTAAIPTVLGGIAQRSRAFNPVWQLGENGQPFCWNVTPRARARGVKGFAGWRFVEVSSEYVNAVTNILKSDPDVAKLLQEGYNVTWIRPIITAVVSGTGDVSLRATQALVLLKGPDATAQVLVDVAQGKVLRITIVSRTVITKS